MITELLALLISYSGIFIGKYLSKAAKEEVEAGRKNLQILKISLSVILNLVLVTLTASSRSLFLSVSCFPWLTLVMLFLF